MPWHFTHETIGANVIGWLEGKNRKGIEKQGKRRIDAYFDWVEEENWRSRFPFGINVRRNHGKDVSK